MAFLKLKFFPNLSKPPSSLCFYPLNLQLQTISTPPKKPTCKTGGKLTHIAYDAARLQNLIFQAFLPLERQRRGPGVLLLADR